MFTPPSLSLDRTSLRLGVKLPVGFLGFSCKFLFVTFMLLTCNPCCLLSVVEHIVKGVCVYHAQQPSTCERISIYTLNKIMNKTQQRSVSVG